MLNDSGHIMNFPKLNFSFEKLKNYKRHHEGIEDFLLEINKYFSGVLDIEEKLIKQEESPTRQNSYMFYIYTKLFLFISINSNFIYSSHISKEFYLFFRNFKKIIKNISTKPKLNVQENFLSAFSQFKSYPEQFSSLINKFDLDKNFIL